CARDGGYEDDYGFLDPVDVW
nr:immunoglobulin heavy chain junction region [Macaca mulatta]